MNTSKVHESIKNSIKHLTLQELEKLKILIDYNLNKKKLENPNRSYFAEQTDFTDKSNFVYEAVVSENFLPDNLSLLLAAVNSTVASRTSDKENKDDEPVQIPPRPSGIWQGKVKIADDFNELSSDIVSDYGLD